MLMVELGRETQGLEQAPVGGTPGTAVSAILAMWHGNRCLQV